MLETINKNTIYKQLNFNAVVDNPGEWGDWTEWSPCTGVCGQGIRDRIRPCDPLFPELGDGDCAGVDEDEEFCYLGECSPSQYKTCRQDNVINDIL